MVLTQKKYFQLKKKNLMKRHVLLEIISTHCKRSPIYLHSAEQFVTISACIWYNSATVEGL